MIMESIIRARAIEKMAEDKWELFFNKYIYQIERDTSDDFTPDKLVTAAKAGNYKRVIDLLHDQDSNLTANSVDHEGMSPLLAALQLIVNR